MNLKLNLLLETIEINLHHLRTMETLYNNYRTFFKKTGILPLCKTFILPRAQRAI